MAEQIKISQLGNVGELNETALAIVTQANGSELMSFNATMTDVADLITTKIQYPELPTVYKSIKGSLIEVANGGFILTSPSGNKFKLAVDDNGALETVPLEEE